MELLHKNGVGPAAIGRELGRAKSTVSRELNRLVRRAPCEATPAQAAADQLASKSRSSTRLTAQRAAEVREQLFMG